MIKSSTGHCKLQSQQLPGKVHFISYVVILTAQLLVCRKVNSYSLLPHHQQGRSCTSRGNTSRDNRISVNDSTPAKTQLLLSPPRRSGNTSFRSLHNTLPSPAFPIPPKCQILQPNNNSICIIAHC